MTELTMKQLADNYGIAFFTFYLIIPFYSKHNANLPLLVLIIMAGLSLYFSVQHKIYQQYSTIRHFKTDSALMLIGLFTLYTLEFFVFGKSTSQQLMTYMLLSISYMPTALRYEKIKKLASDPTRSL